MLERGPLGILFKKIGSADSPKSEPPAAVTRLHMVGENGEAFRVAFEKHPGLPPAESDFGREHPELLELARMTAAKVLPLDVYLKRSPQAQILPARVVELFRGGFGVLALHPNAPPSLVGLHGAELIAVEIDGQSVFPFFDAADLDRIALDTFRRDEEMPPAGSPAQPAIHEERFASTFEASVAAGRQPGSKQKRCPYLFSGVLRS